MREKLRALFRAVFGVDPPVVAPAAPPRPELSWREQWRRQVAENRRHREEERARRRAERRLQDRAYFGRDVWGAAEGTRTAGHDAEKLARYDLPSLASERAVAGWLDIPLSRLRWFTHDKAADTVWHYVRFTVPKRNGGERVILAPKPELKVLQRRVLRELLDRVPQAEPVHGFVPGRSIASNARPHVGREIVLNMDLQDFFPTITYRRVRGLFIALGYSYAVASTLALLCTGYEREPFTRVDALHAEGQRYYVSVGPRHLVQGAPTSPALSNLIARRLDRRLHGLAQSCGFHYTRYADDLTFSGADKGAALRILDVTQRIVADEGFAVNRCKTRLYPRSTRQAVTGVVVNDKTSTPRELRRRLRAILYNARFTGLEAQNREGHPDFAAHLRGLIAHVHAVNPAQGEALLADLEVLQSSSRRRRPRAG